MKASPPLPTVPAREVLARGAEQAARGDARPCPASGGRAQRALEVKPKPDGGADLVDAVTGELVAPCASVAVAERTRDFFK